MAMTPDDRAAPDDGAVPATPANPDDLPVSAADDLDGYTMEELGDYLDRGRTPYDPGIENSASCRLALSGMTRMRELSQTVLVRESRAMPGRDDNWISGLLDTIKAEITSGRDIPVSHSDPALRLALTEAAVRGMIRRAGDTMGGLIMGRCTLDGDVTTPGEPIRVDVTASLEFGLSLADTAAKLRERIGYALARHTELVVSTIDVTIDDIYTTGGQRS
ncbi:Asp23/Gls24 family envelope stress response protein [Frondihabitans sp. Leaf304]|uniref:Asp23/Gls24 family envelope stress response protein n=1 Tax=Frondihabitans sp. Leaf304 TaxID=1736329 RepID=UPI0006F81060|nr:Asp23/Gls24 family envelope stress response protein [Frondihabitans sp. Leaf304]KQQ28434.1 hypothetical protein ASF54_07080 [Frondihabitans sp. Leaf304]